MSGDNLASLRALEPFFTPTPRDLRWFFLCLNRRRVLLGLSIRNRAASPH